MKKKLTTAIMLATVLIGILFFSACSEDGIRYYPIGTYTIIGPTATIITLNSSTYTFTTIPSAIWDQSIKKWDRISGTGTTENPFLGAWKYKDMEIEFFSNKAVTGNSKAKDYFSN